MDRHIGTDPDTGVTRTDATRVTAGPCHRADHEGEVIDSYTYRVPSMPADPRQEETPPSVARPAGRRGVWTAETPLKAGGVAMNTSTFRAERWKPASNCRDGVVVSPALNCGGCTCPPPVVKPAPPVPVRLRRRQRLAAEVGSRHRRCDAGRTGKSGGCGSPLGGGRQQHPGRRLCHDRPPVHPKPGAAIGSAADPPRRQLLVIACGFR